MSLCWEIFHPNTANFKFLHVLRLCFKNSSYMAVNTEQRRLENVCKKHSRAVSVGDGLYYDPNAFFKTLRISVQDFCGRHFSYGTRDSVFELCGRRFQKILANCTKNFISSSTRPGKHFNKINSTQQ